MTHAATPTPLAWDAAAPPAFVLVPLGRRVAGAVVAASATAPFGDAEPTSHGDVARQAVAAGTDAAGQGG